MVFWIVSLTLRHSFNQIGVILSVTHLSYRHMFCFIRYCIDNGGMIAQAGIFAYQMNMVTPLEEATCTQRYTLLCFVQ